MASSEMMNEESAVLARGELPDGSMYHIRLMEKSDVPEVLEVWKEIGLYEGRHTIESFLQVDPKGFYVAVKDEDGCIIGTNAGVHLDSKTAFIGLYAVRPKYQGLGIGMKLWNKMIEHVGDRNAGLHAVPKLRKTYKEKAGFGIEDDRKIIEYRTINPKTEDLVKSIENIKVVTTDENLYEKIIEFDGKIVRYNRGKLLRAILEEHEALSMAAIDQDNGNIVGYGCFRRSNIDTAMAGPIYADNDAVAELIVYNLVEQFSMCKEKELYFMVHDYNPGALRIAQKLGSTKYEELPRFFTKFVPEADYDKVYCITAANFSPY